MADERGDHLTPKEFKGEQFETEGGLDKWYGQQVAAKSEPLIDPGVGKPLLVRVFSFKKNPEVKKYPSKQEVFNQQWPIMRTILWKDGLRPREDHDPKINFNKGGFQIAILCEAQFNVGWVDKPKTLQEILPRKKK